MSIQEFIEILKKYNNQGYPANTEFNKGYFTILRKIIKLAEQLSDKPQISEEDLNCLNKELTKFVDKIYNKGYEDCKNNELICIADLSSTVRNILEKYLKPQPPRTQGDKIRAMSNEELTKEIYKFFIKYEWCALDGKEYICFNEKGFLEFLNSEVKEDE